MLSLLIDIHFRVLLSGNHAFITMNSRGRGTSLTRPAWMHTPRPLESLSAEPSERPSNISSMTVSAIAPGVTATIIAAPTDWTRALTPQGLPYWYSRSTGKTSWTDPAGSITAADPEATSVSISSDRSWRETRTDDGRVYYYNSVTKLTRWDRPPGLPVQVSPNKASNIPIIIPPAPPSKPTHSTAIAVTPPRVQNGASNVTQTTKVSLPLGWAEHRTREGRPYYYHAVTQQTRWDPPTTTKTSDLPSEPHRSVLQKRPPPFSPIKPCEPQDSSRWLQHNAPDGRVYYYNPGTRQTSWVRPVSLDNTASVADTVVTSPDHKRARTSSPVAPHPSQSARAQHPNNAPMSIVRRPRDAGGKPLSDRAAEKYFLNRAEIRRKTRYRVERTPQRTVNHNASQEERTNSFYAMLSDHNVPHSSSWLEAMFRCAEDARYQLLESYGARKNAWEKYCQKRAKGLRRAAVIASRKKDDDFVLLLQRCFDTEPFNVRSLSKCDEDSVSSFKCDPCFRAVDEQKRSDLVSAFFATRERRGILERKHKKDKVLEQMNDALQEKVAPTLRRISGGNNKGDEVMSPINDGIGEGEDYNESLFFTNRTSFRELEHFLSLFPGAEYVSQDDISDLICSFRRQVDLLAEEKQTREREARKRLQHENRGRFRNGILDMVLQGRIPVTAKWKEVSEIVAREKFAKPEAELGFRPSALFEDGMSLFQDRAYNHREKFKQLLKDASVEISNETTIDKLVKIESFVPFCKGLERPILEALLVDRQRKENKRRQKDRERLTMEFENLLRSSDISSDATLDDMKMRLKDNAIFSKVLTLCGEEAVKKAFDEFILWKKGREERKKRKFEREQARADGEDMVGGSERVKQPRVLPNIKLPYVGQGGVPAVRPPAMPREEENGWTAVVTEKATMTEEEKLLEKERQKRELLEALDSKKSLTHSQL